MAMFMFGSAEVMAQQDAQFTQYTFNTLFYNPLNAGDKHKKPVLAT